MSSNRRAFLRNVALGSAAAAEAAQVPAGRGNPKSRTSATPAAVEYPRVFTGRQLAQIAFPLGGVAAGSVSLGGRGQLRDWEIFNRPDKGNTLNHAFPAIWAEAGGKPVVRVLEARYLPPYEGSMGLGWQNAPGLSRLRSARFTGEYPFARIDFEDSRLPVEVSLEAFSPFIPHEADDSGLPVAVLRYRIRNPRSKAARVSVAWSIDNPVGKSDTRVNEYRYGRVKGLLMTNGGLGASDPFHGSFALCTPDVGDAKVTYLRGWQKGRWWNPPMLFWDDFSADGELGPEPEQRTSTGSLCLARSIAPGKSGDFTFLLAWHFPNRTPKRCGWEAPKGEEESVIGNWYSTRFRDAWDAAEYAASNLGRLEKKTRAFAAAIRESTLPAPVKEAASANLSTLATTTCFRTADGEFHGFEGVNENSGCCYGNCTHVWNYETATAHLFPALARSLRSAAFGYSMDDAGAIHFRQLLPAGKQRSGYAAADGQMGQVLHAYLDWLLSGDNDWLRGIWPRVKKAVEFAWVPNGWDADRDGTMEGVQHNTYDVEFYGPNPQCGIYYLAGLRAAEEMARMSGDSVSAAEYRRLFEAGRGWIDKNLFNGEYYVQKIRPWTADRIAPSLRSGMGADDPEHPEFQLGEGCLVDQLVGQYLAEVCDLGPVVDEGHIRKTLESILRYNYKRPLADHDCIQRTFALNDEAALVICDYGKAQRPRIPFPYYAEVMTGFEYSTAVHMLYAGMVEQGIECIENIRRRYDGERRNPWDEAECGHHYARAMASWSAIPALSGFRYHGGEQRLTIDPKVSRERFRCFWATATGWGTFELQGGTGFRLRVDSGRLALKTAVLPVAGAAAAVNGQTHHEFVPQGSKALFRFREPLVIGEGSELRIRVTA